ncbi:MAG: carbon-nitrogen hydrolase family protein [Xanthomonadales bacterium]|nr:carbon-nitrogen hydrolase family protein [Xanthomonadales bacterium]
MNDPTPKERVRTMAVQWRMQACASFEDFAARVGYYAGVAGDYGCDFVCFPEFMALELLAIGPRRLDAGEAMQALAAHAGAIDRLFSELACQHRVNLIGGAFPRALADGSVRNLAGCYHRDGRIDHRSKIHATPSEREAWGVVGGDDAAVIDSDCGPVAIAICYDSEFPELVRHLALAGAAILFVPFCTDERQGYLRVRHCSAARGIENQRYAVLAGTVGHLPRVLNMDIQYAQSCILTPCDHVFFARDGIAVEAAPDSECVVFADLDLARLRQARERGTVRNLADRRPDVYELWRR